MYDLIMVPDGSVNRKLKAAELMEQGVGAYIFATFGPGNTQQTILDYYGSININKNRTIVPVYLSKDTWDDGDQTRLMVDHLNLESILVVVSNYEWVRCNIIFRKDLWGKKVDFITVKDPFTIKRVFTEVAGSIRSLVTK